MDTVARQISLALIVGISFVLCEPPLSNQYGVPGNYAGGNNRGHQGGGGNFGGHSYDNGNDDNQDYIDNQPKSYEFGYAVKDQATGNDFGRRESSDGETVRGEYRVQLPDGRTQIVTYTADWRTGFHADVRYEGTATYPDQYGQNNGYNNNNNNNNNQNNNNGGQGYGYQGNNGGGGGYNKGNNGGYNNYQGAGGNYNGGNNYPYQFGSNSIENGYNNFGARNNFPSPTYGPAFH